jgi:hypothetical protein
VALNPHYRILESGVRQQVVSCIKCGWEVCRPAPDNSPRQAKVNAIARKQKAASAWKPTGNLFRQEPCKVEGCSGTYSITHRTRFFLCPDCGQKMHYWKTHGMKTPPPFIGSPETGWKVNPDYDKRRKRA